MNLRLASITLASVLLSAGLAAAQPYGGGYPPGPPPPEVGRIGLTVGASIGPGAMGVSCDACSEDSYGALAAEAHIGWLFNPKLALGLDFWGNWHFTGDATVGHIVNSLYLQFWPSQIFWLKGGLGLGVLRITYDEDFVTYEAQSDTGLALFGAIGVELLSAPRFALDLSLRAGATAFDGGSVWSSALLIGINWY
jgi:hypothetical protein